MGLPPGIRPQVGVARIAGQQTIEYVLEVGPYVQVVANRAADQRQEVRGTVARRYAADEKPVLPFMLSFA